MLSLSQILSSNIQQQATFAAFRLPNEKSVHLLVANRVETFTFSGQENIFSLEAFIVVPFDNENQQAYRLTGTETVFPLAHFPAAGNFLFPNVEETAVPPDYGYQFDKIKSAITSGVITKAILSRTKTVEDVSSMAAVDIFLRWCVDRPQAYCCLLQLPSGDLWLGASPELLLSRRSDEIRTVALAGTKKLSANNIWYKKEQQEQQIVSHFIAETLRRFTSKVEEQQATTVTANGIQHLKTEFRLPVSMQNKDLAPLTAALHPTPAVCGYPKEKAKQLILNTEQHKRGFYSGFWGKVSAKGDTDFFVNIRCMQFVENKAIIYVGGGITADSEVQAEFAETELKAQSIVDA